MRSLFYLTPLLLAFALAACDAADSSDTPLASQTTTAFAATGAGPGGGGGSLYSDLVFVYRDVDGLPILRPLGGEYCLQPISYEPLPGRAPVINEADGKQVWLLPMMGDVAETASPAAEDDPCEVMPQMEGYVKEVQFGRLNMGRSPDAVLDRALTEVLTKINAATTVLLDHAGRIAPDDVPIDAPRENLAISRELQLRGAIAIPRLPQMPGSQHAFFDHAASALGAAADKEGSVNLDLVVYNNRILEIPTYTTATETLASYMDPAGFMHGAPGETYVLYRDFVYNRSEMFPGCVTGFRLVGLEPQAFSGTLMDEVFGGVDFTGGNVFGFAQRADDARATILFAHDSIITAIDRIGETAVCDLAASNR